MSDENSVSERKNAKGVFLGKTGPIANAAISVVAGGLGAAAASPSLPVILPFAVVAGLAGYFLTNQIPSD